MCQVCDLVPAQVWSKLSSKEDDLWQDTFDHTQERCGTRRSINHRMYLTITLSTLYSFPSIFPSKKEEIVNKSPWRNRDIRRGRGKTEGQRNCWSEKLSHLMRNWECSADFNERRPGARLWPPGLIKRQSPSKGPVIILPRRKLWGLSISLAGEK